MNHSKPPASCISQIISCLICLSLSSQAAIADETTAIEKRLLDAVSYLASDQCEGRSPGSKGIDLAADFIRQQFEHIGLKTALVDGSAFQPFEISDRGTVDENTEMRFLPSANEDKKTAEPIVLRLNQDFTPLGGTSSEPFQLPLAFAGYGITAEKEGYDDYAELDVEGKAVILLRHEPEQADPNSVFNGIKESRYASFRSKLANARKHGAACIIFCTDEFDIRKQLAKPWQQWKKAFKELADEQSRANAEETPTVEEIVGHRDRVAEILDRFGKLRGEFDARLDPLLPFGTATLNEDDSAVPVLHCRREAVDRLLAAAGKPNLASLERQIDRELKPTSFELPHWQVAGRVEVHHSKTPAKNVVALLEGAGPKADEVVVVGAHYDHIGIRRNGDKTEICNGADDNASGVSAIIEIARQLTHADESLPRDVLFIAFSGEERGLLGSRHYVENPLISLDDTVAMVNLDMVGRLRDDELTIYGTGSASGFDQLVDRLGAKYGLTIKKRPSGNGPSDHATFYRKQLPVLFFNTGMHPDLHKPTDDVEKLNVPGMRRVGQMVLELIQEIARADERPKYQEVPDESRKPSGFLGVMPTENADGQGVVLADVIENSPAAKAGLKPGDVVFKVGEDEIQAVTDLLKAIGTRKPEDKVQLSVQRESEVLVVEVVLGAR